MACNISVCSANWQVGPWGSCGVDPVTGNGLKRRSVTCPSGYLCLGTKPAEFDTCKGKSTVIIRDHNVNFNTDFGSNMNGGSYNMRDARY
jgi:hypothetical protein